MDQTSNLTERDHDNIDAFLDAVLDDYKSGAITKSQATGGLNHVMTALAEGNFGEATNWFVLGRKLIRDIA
jgi:hypothetical protein